MAVTSTATQIARRSPARRVVLLSSLLILGLSGAAVGVFAHVPDDQISPGVHVGSLDLGGKSVQDAQSALTRWADAQQNAVMTLHFAADSGIAKTWKPDARKLGLGIDIPATLAAAAKSGREGVIGQMSHWIGGGKTVAVVPVTTTDDARLRLYLTNQIAQDIYRPARRARLLATKGGGFGVRHEQNGVTLDKDASAQAVTLAWSRYFAPGQPAAPGDTQRPASVDGASVASPTHDSLLDGPEAILTQKALVPELTAASLEQIDGKLAEFSTYYSGIRNRRDNIVLAVRHIDGTLLQAGEIFSYNKTVGPRDSQAGFKPAPQYLNGKHVMGEGGGICQVSSTLFNAALLSSLKIVRRQNHSMPVGYLRHGRDATAAYGAIDMQFQNDTPAPIYIRASAKGGLLQFSIWGKRTPGREVVMQKGRETNTGSPVETHRDPRLAAGRRVVEVRGSPGINVTWYRIIKENGQVVKREPFTSHYTAFPTIVAVGTRARKAPALKPGSSPPSGAPGAAPSGAVPAPPANSPGV